MAIDLARTTAALKTRLDQFSTPQKTIVALLAVVGVIAAGTFIRWITAPSYEVLMAGLAPADAAAVTEQLDTSGVPYQLAANGTTILVPSSAVQQQRLAVAAAGLPEGTTKGYELLDEQGMTSSSFQQKVAYQRAVEGELSKTLEQMKDVRTATIHLSVPDKELYTDKATPSRASVLLDTSGTLPRDAVDSVQRLVAAAVPDLEPSGVTVSDTKGTLLSSDGGTGNNAEAQQAIEDAAIARADSMLASVLGPGKAVVRVNAELDTTARTSESEKYDPKSSVLLRKDSANETYDGAAAPVGGAVSVPDPVVPGSGSGATKYGKANAKEEYGVTRQVDTSTTAPGGLRRMTVAVVVDNQALGLTKAAVSDLVSNAVGIDATRGDTISVETVAFPEPVEAAAGVTAPPRDMMRLATIAVAGLLLLLITAAFLRAARRGSVQDIPLSQLTLDGPPEQAALVAAPARALEIDRGAAEQDMKVLELVDSRPDEVSALIRSWLAEPVPASKT